MTAIPMNILGMIFALSSVSVVAFEDCDVMRDTDNKER